MTKSLNNLQPLGALVMRLALGVSMSVHGYEKVIPHGALNHYVHYIVSLGLPHWLGYVSAYTEFVGGILLIIGLLTRLTAALIAINMLVAFFYVGIHQGFGIYNYILALVALGIMLTFYGAGALALDRKIGFSTWLIIKPHFLCVLRNPPISQPGQGRKAWHQLAPHPNDFLAGIH